MAVLSPFSSGVVAMDGLGLGAAFSALLGLGAGGQATMRSTDVFTPDGRRSALEPSALGHCLTLPTDNTATSRRHY